MHIINANQEIVVSYEYDAWGKVLSISGDLKNSIGAENPFRYRGYYYDDESGFYYLNSRYYDPETGRFINADAYVSTGQGFAGFNMYAYCLNNPVNYVDYSGNAPYSVPMSPSDYLSLAGMLGVVAVAAPAALLGGAIIAAGYIYVNDAVDSCNEYMVSKATSKPDEGLSSSTGDPNSEEVDKNGRPVVKPGQQPTESEGYIAPKGGPVKGKTKDGKIGWVDKNGNVWVPAPTGSSQDHGGGHWDVQSPKGGYINVYPGGVTRGGKAPFPKLPIY